MIKRKKFCKMCIGKYHFDYKDARFLSQFLSDNGRIIPRRITGACALCQRKITTAVKRARHLALLPYVRR
jgi:small subunit ribosomal protein S18